jgi:hypothetical protein
MPSPSPGTGADLTPLEASDLLKKLITESTKVQATLSTTTGLVAAVTGFVMAAPDGAFGVLPDRSGTAPTSFALFKPSLAIRFKYGDDRAIPSRAAATIPGAPRFLSGLSFVFADNSQITLFEIAAAS